MVDDAMVGDPQTESGSNVLVVFAHPQRRSFCGAALEQVVAGIAKAGGTSRVRDLYNESFDPRLTSSEFERERKHGRDADVSPDVRNEQEDVMWADSIVFICPLWWSDVPAILKGWFDRVWSKGFAWASEGEPELAGVGPKKALLLVSAGNSYDKLAEDGVVQALEVVVLGDRLKNVGFESAELVLLDGLEQADQSKTQELLEAARSAATRVALSKI